MINFQFSPSSRELSKRRWPPACPVPVTARQQMAAALGRGFTGWAWRCWPVSNEIGETDLGKPAFYKYGCWPFPLLPKTIGRQPVLVRDRYVLVTTGPTHAKLVSLTSPRCSGWPAPMNTLKANNGPLGSVGCAGFSARLKSDLMLIFYFNSTNE